MAKRRKRGGIHFDRLSDDDAALLARHGDTEAHAILWHSSIDQAGRIAGLFARRYPWIDHEDLTQSILLDFPKIIRRYNPVIARAKSISWNKYAYFAFYRAAQDALRREDPLGVSIPQKAHYPSWRRFSEISGSANLIQAIVLDGLGKIDRGDSAVMDEASESSNWPAGSTRMGRREQSPEYHDFMYHGKQDQQWLKADSH